MQNQINIKSSTAASFPVVPLPASRALAFVPGLVRVGAAVGTNASVPTQRLRPPLNAPVLPARRGLAFNDNCVIPALSTPRTGVAAPLSNAGLGVGLAASSRYRHTNVARQKISAANKGNIPWNKGRKHSEETKAKISMATRAAMGTPEIRAKLRFHATGRKHSEETKRKIRTSTRKKRAGNGRLFGKVPQRRTPVPFIFNPEMHTLLDSRISKRYRAETVDGLKTIAGRPKRPMPEATKRKLSERIRALWAENEDYRDRVRLGIESRKEKTGRASLSESHRASISRTLKEKHAARRAELGLPPSPKPRARRPRKVTASNDPAVGTRFSEAYLSPEAKLARDERRELTRKLLDDAEEVQKESNTRRARETAQKKRVAEEKEAAKTRKEAREAQNNDRILIESLALAGQLPSLEEECAMVGSTFQFGSATQTKLPFMETAGFDSTDVLFLDPVESLPDPLLGDPMPTSATTGTASNSLFGSSSTSNAFGGGLFTTNPFPNIAAKVPSAASTTSKNKKRTKKGMDDDDVLSMPFMGNEAVFAEEAEDDDDDDDELEEPASISNGSVQDSSPLKGTLLEDELEFGGEGSVASDLESIIFGSPNRRVYRYVNGERVLQTVSNS